MKKVKRKKRGGVTKHDRIQIMRTLQNPTMFERNISSVKGARP